MKWKAIILLMSIGLSTNCSGEQAFSEYGRSTKYIEGCYEREGFDYIYLKDNEIYYGESKVFDIINYGYVGRNKNRVIYVSPRLYLQDDYQGGYEFRENPGLPSGYNSAFFGYVSEELEGLALDVNFVSRDIRFTMVSDKQCEMSQVLN